MVFAALSSDSKDANRLLISSLMPRTRSRRESVNGDRLSSIIKINEEGEE